MSNQSNAWTGHRVPIVGGNWKMNTDRVSGLALANAVASAVAGVGGVEVVIFPPFPYLAGISEALCAAGSAVILGAQDVYHADRGAFTGEVSPVMLKDVGVKMALCGHSERRHVLHEGDDMVNAKLQSALGTGLHVTLCVGEKFEERVTDQTNTVIERQTERGLRDITAEQLSRIVIAYEPVWAIGTGKVATPEDAQSAHAHIRTVVGHMFGPAAGAAMRIQYGGSVTAANAAGLFGQPDVDGGLIGGASLKAEDFVGIVKAAANTGAGR